MSDKYNTLNYSRMILCPWCGRLLSFESATIDHVLPISEWRRIRRTTKFLEFEFSHGINCSVNDIRNRVLTCKSCNVLKGCKVLIPNWSFYGDFKFWEICCLFRYATYVYFWYDIFMSYYEFGSNCSYLDEAIRNRQIAEDLREFKEEYEYRVKTGNWYIDKM